MTSYSQNTWRDRWQVWWQEWWKLKSYEKCFRLALYTIYPFGKEELWWIYTSIPQLLIVPAFFLLLGGMVWVYEKDGGRTILILFALAVIVTIWQIGFGVVAQGIWSGIAWFFESFILYWKWLLSHVPA